MNRCPLCLNEQASSQRISDGYGESTVSVTSIPPIDHVTCSACGEYKITEDAIFFLQRCDEMRQRAVTDMRKRDLIGQAAGQGEILTITSEMLQGYWQAGDTVSA